MKKTLCKLLSAAAALALTAAAALPIGKIGRVEAATKRTAVVASLLTARGKINTADWNALGDTSKIQIANNGKVFKVSGARWPGYRIAAYNSVPAGESYRVEFDVLSADPQTAKLNLSGFVTSINNGAASNIYLSSVGIDPGAGTNYGTNGDGGAVWNKVNSTLDAGYRYRFTFQINEENSAYGDFIIARKPLDGETEEYTEGCVLTKLCSLTEEAHYAHVYFEGDISIDNFKVEKEDGTLVQETDFSDASVLDTTGVAQENKIFKNGGDIVNDTYLRLAGVSESEKLVSYLKIKGDETLENAFELNASVKVASTAGKAGILFGMDEETAKIGDDGVSYLYFENGAETTTLNMLKDGEEMTAVDLGKSLSDNFYNIKVVGKNDGDMLVYVDGELKAAYEDQNFEGYVGVMTDGGAGTDISFLPAFTVDSYAYEEGTGPDLENNFNTGYLNPTNYENDTHNAVSLGGNARGIVAEDGVLKFAGTNDGTHFAINGVYADFILQFDWINYAWDDRPTKEDGKVNFVDKPADGLGTELYSPLGISLGKSTPTAGWAEAKLLRFFDTYNLVQFINNNEGAGTVNAPMGSGFATPEECEAIQSGKIAFYENTVNLKLVALNGSLKVYGVVMKDGAPVGEHSLLAEFEYENCTGYISLSTSEAGYFGIDNLRVTKIDGWTQAQIDGYENFKTIADEAAPTVLNAPVLTVTDKKVTWEAVENASGYIVTVNGVSGEVTKDTSYDLSAAAQGDYEVTVKAVGDGALYVDSEDSAPVSVQIGGAGNNSSSSHSESSGGGGGTQSTENGCKGGCGSIAGLSLLSCMLPAAALLLIHKKKQSK